ncbi:hypothetical protein Purlil1_6487 [Purpureocillium lilacinum]|uniref:Uncharacterized protein n=1 Tax=Purpureocillium lilacinum TaxID=33203 RepID=A0ABR0BY73_PURLI|nr:hypothetical protein Purlil1_6487 [Purpureocillium lilacinum]
MLLERLSGFATTKVDAKTDRWHGSQITPPIKLLGGSGVQLITCDRETADETTGSANDEQRVGSAVYHGRRQRRGRPSFVQHGSQACHPRAMWAPQVVTSTSIRACWSARARSLGLCTRRILVVGLKPRASTGCRSGAPGLAVQAQVSCGLDTAWVPPRKQANTRQLPGFGDKARSKGAAGVCGYDQRGTAGPTGHAALAAPPAARLLALARGASRAQCLTGCRGADQAGRLAGAAQRSAPGLGTFCLPPSSIRSALCLPAPLSLFPSWGGPTVHLHRHLFSAPRALAPSLGHTVFRSGIRGTVAASCRVVSVPHPQSHSPGFGGRVPVLNSRHGSWRTQRSKPCVKRLKTHSIKHSSIAPARLWLIPALQELGSRPHRAVETRAPMASYGLAGGTARQVNCLQQAAGEDIHARKWTRHETCQLLPDDACT